MVSIVSMAGTVGMAGIVGMVGKVELMAWWILVAPVVAHHQDPFGVRVELLPHLGVVEDEGGQLLP